MKRRNFLRNTALAGVSPLAFSANGSFQPATANAIVHPLSHISREEILITDVKVTPLSYVHEDGPLWGVGDYIVWKTDACLVEVFTDQGIVGIGEGSPYSEPDKIKAYTDQKITPYIKGLNPFDTDFFTAGGPHQDYLARAAYAGINNACWDIIGKVKNEPVYRLLAQDFTPPNRMKIYASGGVNHAWYRDGEQELIEEALRYKEAGYDAFKFRNGTNWEVSGMTLEKHIDVLRKLREAVGPDFKLMLEKHPHSLEAIVQQLAPALEDLNFYWFEEPMNQWEEGAVERHLEIKEAMPSVMISGGERYTNRLQLMEWINSGAYDIIQSDCNFTGISEGWHIAHMAHLFGRLQCPHNWHGGLTTMANLHFVAGVPNGHMCELNQTYNPLKDAIFKEPLKVEAGYMILPDKPGFGLEITDNVASKFPYTPGKYLKPNPEFTRK